MSRDTVKSAGGVLVRVGAEGVEVVVLHRVAPDEWRLPKGQLAEGETPEATALRETREESGVLAEILAPLGEGEHEYVDRRSGQERVKHTTYYLLRPVSPTYGPADPEFDEVVWLPAEEAAARLTFDEERRIVRAAVEKTAGR